MFDDIMIELRRISRESTDVIYDFRIIQRRRDEIQRELQELEREYDSLVQNKNDIYSETLNIVKEQANIILTEEMIKATELNREFSDNVFLDRLISVCSNPRSIEIILVGKSISIEINLNETAGTLEDYANAITLVRGQLSENKVSVTSSEMASKFWKEKFYKPAREGTQVKRRKYNRATKKYEKRDVTQEQIQKYWDTINLRLQASGKIAPFWEILDQGTPSLSSDVGGTAYPKNRRTNFTGKTISRLRNLFREQTSSGSNSTATKISDIDNLISEIRVYIEEIDGMIDELTIAALDIQERLAHRIVSILDTIDKTKIPNAELLLRGYRETNKTRYTVSGVRIRVKREINFLQKTLGNE